MVEKLKAILLIPAAYAGAFTGLAFDIPPRTAADVVIALALLLPVLRRLGRHPPLDVAATSGEAISWPYEANMGLPSGHCVSGRSCLHGAEVRSRRWLP